MKAPDLKRETKRQRIKDRVVQWIGEQGLEPGDRILSQNQLAKIFSVTPVTIHHALTELAAEGVVHRIKGKGTFAGPDRQVTLTKSLCFVLPGEGLDQPDRNPEYWPCVQHMLQSFLTALGNRWSFTTRAVLPDASPDEAADDLARHDLVFFHFAQQPLALMRHLCCEERVPVAAFGMPRRGIPCLTVDHDRRESVRRGVGHLIGRGYQRIAFIGSREFWGEEAFEGFAQALAEQGQTPEPERVVRVGDSQDEGLRGAGVLLARETACDAVFVDSDLRALGVLECLRQRGVRVPEDMGLMGYDGLPLVTAHPPYLTTVRLPYANMIHATLAELERSDGVTLPRKHLTFVGEIVPGRTTM